jgi:hypothetical protein
MGGSVTMCPNLRIEIRGIEFPTNLVVMCHRTSQDIRPTYRCACPMDLRQSCRCTQ